eukprot:TRINITY_DN4467_c0_g3_i1.p1 TRINITY_DN4467_c0_g3~~TRINITY_DN4467_c0_g3_i1.p1  ORF type:complete len:151 (+),score=1.18 TRINITY_DN4467_c0_g3_i1:713-1165(+)
MVSVLTNTRPFGIKVRADVLTVAELRWAGKFTPSHFPRLAVHRGQSLVSARDKDRKGTVGVEETQTEAERMSGVDLCRCQVDSPHWFTPEPRNLVTKKNNQWPSHPHKRLPLPQRQSLSTPARGWVGPRCRPDGFVVIRTLENTVIVHPQ